MDLIQAYPGAFLMTVILPLVTGILVTFGGYETLKARAGSDAHLLFIHHFIRVWA
jgi:hypothetical protein